MPSTTETAVTEQPTTSIIYRPSGGITRLREAIDETANLAVLAFPIECLDQVTAVRPLAFPACYMLTNSSAAYVGETGNVGMRLAQHITDQTKNFATEAFVIGAANGRHLDKAVAIYLQHYFSKAVDLAGLASLTKGKSPQAIELPFWRQSSLEQLAQCARRLIFDAGCRALDSNNPRVLLSVQPDSPSISPAFPIEVEDIGPLTIGVPMVPEGCEEFQLNYANIWARGYSWREDFVVHAGSEIRIGINQSVNAIFIKRRRELFEAGALEQIRGVDDRQRLTISVAFRSAAIAAKVVTGAHVNANTWQRLRHAQPVIEME